MATAGILTLSEIVGEPSGLVLELTSVVAEAPPPSSLLEVVGSFVLRKDRKSLSLGVVGPGFVLRKDKNSLKPGVSGLNGPHSMASIGVAGGGIVTDRDVFVVVVVAVVVSWFPPPSSRKWLSSRRMEEDMVNSSSSESTSAGVGETTSASGMSLPSSSSSVEKMGPCAGVVGSGSVDGIAALFSVSVGVVVDDDEAPMLHSLMHWRSSSSSFAAPSAVDVATE